ncbi:dynein regulatory complex protein 1 [Trichogramma pretiosum]|uniref:dynein regulatory complex protein 1 n=1 Tax=Trichogramma pretiosum TaxID=7493 RepID=UPI0006C9A774|nr:dynein regulatory complex protein 1 [Trichogramma pretiosum]
MSIKSSLIDKDFGSCEEPSTLSTDPNERKLARRLRIQRRVEALQKLDGYVDDVIEEHEVTDETLTEKQIQESAELLENLLAEGNEVITNVRVANDARELERRREAAEIQEQLLQRLEASASECRVLYDVISERWPAILASNDPLDINGEMDWQRDKCEEVLAKKDAIILELKEALRKADDKYFEDQRRQKDDIRLLIERIENQITTMENSYDRELDLVTKTIKSERDALVASFERKWDELYRQEEEEDAEGDRKRRAILDDYEREMERLMQEHDEEYRAQKIELEKECQDLQQQLERTKALCLLNAEKLSYNYTVLKSREEENSVVASLQKRKINKLQALLTNLKKNYADFEESTKLEIERLSSQILRAHKSIAELEDKSVHFTRVNEKQYLDIWDMNTHTANELLKKILAADRDIYERTLGILWEPPDNSVLTKEELPSYRAAVNFIEKQKQEERDRVNIFDFDKAKKSLSDMKLEREVLNNILKQIANCSGYLIEDKLQELIADRSEQERTIIQLENVFQALSISSPEEINLILEFFLPYTYCPICVAKCENAIRAKSSSSSSGKSVCSCTPELTGGVPSVCEADEHVKTLVETVKEEIKKAAEDAEKQSSTSACTCDCSDSSTESDKDGADKPEDEENCKRHAKSKFTCEFGHVLQIQSAHVTKAMKEIISKLSNAEQKKLLTFEERLREKKYTISRNISEKDVKAFWASYRDLFGTQKEKLWDAILMGLTKYHEVLKERHKLSGEVEALKTQNEELQRLLKSYNDCPDEEKSALTVKPAKYSSHF